MGKLNKLNEDKQNLLIATYNNGSSLKEIATLYECTSPTVATFLRGKGVAVRGKGKRKKIGVMDNGMTSSAPTIFAGGCVEPIEDLNPGDKLDLEEVGSGLEV